MSLGLIQSCPVQSRTAFIVLGIDVSAMLKKQCDHVRMATMTDGSIPEGRFAPLISRVGASVAIEQYVNGVEMAVLGGQLIKSSPPDQPEPTQNGLSGTAHPFIKSRVARKVELPKARWPMQRTFGGGFT